MTNGAIRTGMFTGGLCLAAAVASAQGPGPGGPVGIAAGLQQQYNGLKNNLTQAAEVVPEAGYGQKVGTMSEVRPAVVCVRCGGAMKAVRHTPKVGAFPALTTYRCDVCQEIVTFEADFAPNARACPEH